MSDSQIFYLKLFMSGKGAYKGTRRNQKGHKLPTDPETGGRLLIEDRLELIGYDTRYMLPKHKRGSWLWWWIMSLIVPIMDADVQELTANVAYIHMIIGQDIQGLRKRGLELAKLDSKLWTVSDFGDIAIIARRAQCDQDQKLAKELQDNCWRTRSRVMKELRRKTYFNLLTWIGTALTLFMLLLSGVIDGIYKFRGLETPPIGTVLIQGLISVIQFFISLFRGPLISLGVLREFE